MYLVQLMVGFRAGEPGNPGPNACWLRQPLVSYRCGKGRVNPVGLARILNPNLTD